MKLFGMQRCAIGIGLLCGLIAGASAADHPYRASNPSQRSSSTAPEQGAVVSTVARRTLLRDGRVLTLHANGSVLTLTDPGKSKSARSWPIPATSRMNASVTLMPSGRVLIWGGSDRANRPQSDGLWFDPELQTLTSTGELPLSARAAHTATVLTDGTVLFAGGSHRDHPAELWDERSNHVTPVPAVVSHRLKGHRAELQPDGRVRLFGGKDSLGRPVTNPVLFDPRDVRFKAQTDQPVATPQAPALAASLPKSGEQHVQPDARLALRFSERVRITDLNTSKITLIGPGGATQVRIAPVEEGRLVFVTPEQDLFPDSNYTLLVDGVRSVSNKTLRLIAIDFRTAALAAHEESKNPLPALTGSVISTGKDASAAGCASYGASLQPCRASGRMQEGIWTPGRDNTDARWRVSGPQPELTRIDIMARVTEAIGFTTVVGRIQRTDGVPVGNVEVSIGKVAARTDAAGNFTLYNAPDGKQELYVDGTTANRTGVEYGQFVIGVDVKRGTLTQLPYTMYLPRIAARDKVRISSPLARDVVLTHPDMPGLQVQIPAGTVIRDRKGRLVTELALVPTPVNRAPFPVATNYPMYFTIEPGGAAILGLTPEAAKGVRVFYPNYDGHKAGTQADFWIYDPAEGWRVYGKGRVTSDGTRFAPEQGVALHQTMGGSYSIATNDPPPNEDLPPDGSCCGSPGDGGAANTADPIDLRTGDFIHSETDITIADVVPLQLSRSYRPRDVLKREFGLGTASNFNYKLNVPSSGATDTLGLTLPNGAVIKFTRVSGSGYTGKWRQNGSTTGFSAATIELLGQGGYQLLLRNGAEMRFDKYAPNQLQWTQDRFGSRIEFVYDAGLVSRIVSPSGRYIALQYDTQNRIDIARDSAGNAWDYDYDANGLLSKVTYPDTTYKRYTYKYQTMVDASCPPGASGANCSYYLRHSQLGNPLRMHAMEAIFDQRGKRMLFNEYEPLPYNWIGKVLKQTQADNSFYTIDYAHSDGTSIGVLVTHPDGSKRRVVFGPGSFYPQSDTVGYGTALAQTTRFERNPTSGQINASIDPLLRRTEYQYNGSGQVTQVTYLADTPDAKSVHVTYTPDGQLETVRDPLDRTTTLGYTAGCLTSITNPLLKVTYIACNAAGQPTSVTDPLNKTTQLRYLGYDLVAVIDPLLRTTQIRYDSLGRMTAVEDPEGNIVRREYDAIGRVEKVFDAANEMTVLGYDGNGNVEAVLMPHGNGITYDYDDLNRLTDRYDSLGKREHWTYDGGTGRVDTYTDRKLQVTDFDYDVLGRPATTAYANGGGTVTSGFDAGNRLRTLIDSLSGTLSWDYDDFDQVTLATTPQGTIGYEYDDVGRREAMTAASQPRVQYEYDDADRLQRILQGPEVVDFDYDDADRLTQTTLPNNITTGYAYNDASQLTGIAWLKPDQSLLGDLGYGYDPTSGRRTAQTGSFASSTLPTASTGNVFDDNHRQTQYQGQVLAYDDNGNLISDGTKTYLWNARDQLTEIKQGVTTLATFAYDTLGRRIARTEGGQATTYLYDGTDAVQETQGAQTVPVLTGLGIDERYARTDNSGRTYFLTDALGSTRALTNASGAVVQRYDYDPYGNTTATQSGFSNPYQYTGREKDANGLQYYRARYYNSGMSRFISEDPIGLAAGLNTYAYVGGNPISYVDPFGLDWQFSVGIGANAGGSPSLVGGLFGGGGFSLGFTSTGQVFFQVSANAQAGVGGFAGVGLELSGGKSECPIKPGMSTEKQAIGTFNIGKGGSVGASVQGTNVRNMSLSSGVPGVRFGVGYGVQLSGGMVTQTTFASPPLWPGSP